MPKLGHITVDYDPPFNCMKHQSFDYFSEAGTFTLIVHNESGKWVDVCIDRPDGTVLSTGHIQNGDSATREFEMAYFPGNLAKVTRWRPGLFDVPGNGGGELRFITPDNAKSMTLELTCQPD